MGMGGWEARSDGVPEVGQGLPEEDAVAAFHLGLDAGVEGLVRGQPGEVEGIVLRGAVAGHGDDEGAGPPQRTDPLVRAVGSGRPEQLHDLERQLERLLVVQPRVDERLVALGEPLDTSIE